MFSISENTLTGVILAGGRATRMGGQDKGLLPLCSQPMIAHVLSILRPQVDAILINANRNLDVYRALGYEVISDEIGEYFGPLAGMLAAMNNSSSDLILTAPCDSPLLPANYAQRMLSALTSGPYQLCVAHDGRRLQPVFALLPTKLRADLKDFLASGARKIDRWFGHYAMVTADFSDNQAMFRNINTPTELAALEAQLSSST